MMIKHMTICSALVLSFTACTGNQDSGSDVLATETVVDEPLASTSIKHDLCDAIENEYYANTNMDCDAVDARIVKKYESNGTLTMMDIKAKNDRFTCSARAKRVLGGQFVDDNGDIVTTQPSWKTSLNDCSPNSLKDHLEDLADNANIGNGDAVVGQFDLSTFVYNDEVKKLEKDLKNQPGQNGCKFETVRSTQGSIDSLNDLDMEDDVVEALQKLKNEGKIKNIISRSWDGSSGDSEYCSYFYFNVYTNEGLVLFLHYDQTT